MTTPKREEPPFVSNDWIVDKAREIATDICGPEPVPTPDDFEDDPKSEWHATFDGACKLGFEVQKEHELLVSRLRTEREGEPRRFTEEEVRMMLRDTLSAALKNRLALDSTSIRQESERHIAEHYGLDIFNT